MIISLRNLKKWRRKSRVNSLVNLLWLTTNLDQPPSNVSLLVSSQLLTNLHMTTVWVKFNQLNLNQWLISCHLFRNLVELDPAIKLRKKVRKSGHGVRLRWVGWVIILRNANIVEVILFIKSMTPCSMSILF